jgi:exportin-1
MEDQVPTIMENVFECTLEMINKDFSEFPEHRVEFFTLLRAVNLHCFPGTLYPCFRPSYPNLTDNFVALLKLDNRQFKFVIDSCMWASKHDNREVEYAGLNMCLELITNIAETDPGTSNAFFRQFFIPILQDVFFVLTDTDHKAGFKSQSMLLSRMFYFVEPADGTRPKIQGPIYQPDQAPEGTSNKEFLGGFVGNLLQNAFPNLQP